MLKIFLSVNAFSLLAFFRDVPLGIKKTHSVSVMTLHQACPKLCKVIKMLRIPLLELILKHGSSRIRPGTKYWSLSLVQRRFSLRNTWRMPHHFSIFTKEFKDYETRNYFATKAQASFVHVLLNVPIWHINRYIVYKRSGCLALKNIAYYKIYTLWKTALCKNISYTCGWSDWKFLSYIFCI